MKSNEKLEIPFIFHTIGKLIEAETLTRVFGYQRCNVLTETPIQHVSSVTPLVPCMSCQWAVDLHWWIYILSCLLELKWDGGAGALHYLWLQMTIVEEDTDWGKPCQRASSSSSWRSHVAHVLSIHPGWNTQRWETHPECCSMECVHGMCVHGGDVGANPLWYSSRWSSALDFDWHAFEMCVIQMFVVLSAGRTTKGLNAKALLHSSNTCLVWSQ